MLDVIVKFSVEITCLFESDVSWGIKTMSHTRYDKLLLACNSVKGSRVSKSVCELGKERGDLGASREAAPSSSGSAARMQRRGQTKGSPLSSPV